MSADKTKNKKLKGLSMYEVSKKTGFSYPTIRKWARGGKVHKWIDEELTKYIEENGTK